MVRWPGTKLDGAFIANSVQYPAILSDTSWNCLEGRKTEEAPIQFSCISNQWEIGTGVSIAVQARPTSRRGINVANEVCARVVLTASRRALMESCIYNNMRSWRRSCIISFHGRLHLTWGKRPGILSSSQVSFYVHFQRGQMYFKVTPTGTREVGSGESHSLEKYVVGQLAALMIDSASDRNEV